MRKAISLTDILCAIAIICVLTAIAYPMVGKLKERAGESSCLQNLKQLYVALSIYRQEEGADGLYGKPNDMGLPPRLDDLKVPQDLLEGCRGIDPLRSAPASGYFKLWPASYAPFQSDRADAAWSDYAKARGDSTVVIEDPNHQLAYPVTPFSTRRSFGVHLNGSIEVRVHRGPQGYSWWHSQGG